MIKDKGKRIIVIPAQAGISQNFLKAYFTGIQISSSESG